MPFRVAIVGSGLAGFYAAGPLARRDIDVEVDMIERLPTPWGLVRLGVAPDHPNIKAVSQARSRRSQPQPGFRFLGNVEVGRDLRPRRPRLYDRVYDRVVEAGEILGREVAANLDVAEESEARLRGDLPEPPSRQP